MGRVHGLIYSTPLRHDRGRPNGDGLPDWPEFDVKTNPVTYIGQKFEAGTMPELPVHFLMDTFMNSKRVYSSIKDIP